jgi:hypothetical protein
MLSSLLSDRRCDLFIPGAGYHIWIIVEYVGHNLRTCGVLWLATKNVSGVQR